MNCNDDIGRDARQRMSAGAHQREPSDERLAVYLWNLGRRTQILSRRNTQGRQSRRKRLQLKKNARTQAHKHTTKRRAHKRFNERDMLSPFLTMMMMRMETMTKTRGYRTEWFAFASLLQLLMVGYGRAVVPWWGETRPCRRQLVTDGYQQYHTYHQARLFGTNYQGFIDYKLWFGTTVS